MNRLPVTLFVVNCTLFLTQLNAQALYEVPVEEKVANSSIIVEGRVLDQRSFWNPKHTMIYTANTVEVYKSFKGTIQSATIEVMTVGGTVGTDAVDASDLLVLDKGNIGVFFCYPNSINLVSPFTGNRLFDVYSSGQGCYTYDLGTKTANAPFVRYGSIENQLYKELARLTGKQPEVINNSFNISAAQAKPASPLAPVITSFSPTLVNAGATGDPATNLLIINGSGFGNAPADSAAILFDDANDGSGGTPFKVAFNSPLVQSWTDAQIRVRVPGRAGTGLFTVKDNANVAVPSPDILSVNYAVLTREATNAGVTIVKEINLMDDNGLGGYSLLYSTSTGGDGVDLNSAPEKETFQRALNTWREVAGLNFSEAGVTTIQAVAGDNANVIMFDNTNTGNTPLAAGVLAVCYSFSNLCTPVANNGVQKTEFDIVIRNTGVSSGSTNFTSGPCPPAIAFTQIDLETVLLHELGHGLNLAHVNDPYQGASLPNINPSKLMHYAVVNGVSRKSPDYAAYSGALYCIRQKAIAFGACLATAEMTSLARTIVPNDECPVTFPAVTTPPNTTVQFDLIHATSNKFADPAYTEVNCLGTGASVTNNAYYAIRSDNDGGTLNIMVSGYSTYPANVQADCTGAGVRLSLYEVASCPEGQNFPSPVQCRNITRNGSLPAINGLAANTNYLVYVDGLLNTKASFSLTFNGSVLPVTLLTFQGALANNKVNLAWKTSSETNSREFVVEKSFDGTQFSQFAVVAAKGTATGENKYALSDEKPYSDYTFYRLKIVDKDGKFDYSAVVKIKTPKKALVITRIYPNPASDKINVEVLSDSKKALTIETFDLLGQRVANLSVNVETGLNNKQVYVNTLASGTYILQVKDASGTVVEKIKFLKN